MKRVIYGFIVIAFWTGYLLLSGEGNFVQVESPKRLFNTVYEGSAASLPQPRKVAYEVTSQQHLVSTEDSVLLKANKYLEDHKEELHLQPFHDIEKSVSTTPLGSTVVFTFSQGGLPIVGMSIRIKMDLQSQITDVENTYIAFPKVDFSKDDLLQPSDVVKYLPSRFVLDEVAGFQPARQLMNLEGASELTPAYVIRTRDRDDNLKPITLLINAVNGELLYKVRAR